MNILFICSRNQWRSPTAEAIYKNDKVHTVRSAGTEPSARVRVTSKLINWADIIFAMEKKHKQRLVENFPIEMLNKKVVVLDIPDDYHYMDAELIDTIEISVSPYLGNVKD
jgi:predicted protein tyrosine phosphatase